MQQVRLLTRFAEGFHLYLGGLRSMNIWMDNLPELDNEKNK